ncbi:MAG: chaperone NapD [Campylobacteraceae bacterium]
MNISSIVVSTLPKNIEKVIERLKKIPHVDYHFHDEMGRIIVTIEAKNVSDEIAVLHKIEKVEGVISADMSYSYAEEELEKERALIGKNDKKIIKDLNTEQDANDISYKGSVYTHLDEE